MSDICLPSLSESECVDLMWYFSVVFHHVATEGSALEVFELPESDVMKSEMMAFCDGLKLPYQIKLTEISPVRSGPLWYCKRLDESLTNSVSRLAPSEILNMENKMRMWNRGWVNAILKMKWVVRNWNVKWGIYRDMILN